MSLEFFLIYEFVLNSFFFVFSDDVIKDLFDLSSIFNVRIKSFVNIILNIVWGIYCICNGIYMNRKEFNKIYIIYKGKENKYYFILFFRSKKFLFLMY